jgi:hypothetical protein
VGHRAQESLRLADLEIELLCQRATRAGLRFSSEHRKASILAETKFLQIKLAFWCQIQSRKFWNASRINALHSFPRDTLFENGGLAFDQ